MSTFFGKNEMENLRSLKKDLLDPVKSFVEEVHGDTVGDAKRFYSDQAQKVGQGVRTAQEKARLRREAIRREQEALRKRRKTMMKRAAVVIVIFAALCMVIVSVALNVRV